MMGKGKMGNNNGRVTALGLLRKAAQEGRTGMPWKLGLEWNGLIREKSRFRFRRSS